MQVRKAYTLMELILAMAVIAILAGVSYPSVMSMYGYYRLQAAADGVRSAWVGARAHAVEEGQRYRFSVVPGKRNFRIAPDSPDYWTGTNPSFDSENPPLIVEDVLPRGIVFTINGGSGGGGDSGGEDNSAEVNSVNPGDWQTIATFEADGTATDGTAQQDVTIHLSYPNGGSRPIVVNLRALTAISSAKPASLQGQR